MPHGKSNKYNMIMIKLSLSLSLSLYVKILRLFVLIIIIYNQIIIKCSLMQLTDLLYFEMIMLTASSVGPDPSPHLARMDFTWAGSGPTLCCCFDLLFQRLNLNNTTLN